MIAIAQEIKTTWTKASRGFPLSVRRNAVPDTFIIPIHSLAAKDSMLLEHRVWFAEQENFDLPHHTINTFAACDVISYGCVKLELMTDSINVVWQYNHHDGGAPDRGSKPKQAFSLTPNQCGRITYNGRFAYEGGWSYRKTVLNIALVTSFDAQVFANHPPDFIYEQLAQLA